MAAQAALIAGTIAGMKRAISGHEYCKSLRHIWLLRYGADRETLQRLIPMIRIYNPPTEATSSSVKRGTYKKGNWAVSAGIVATKG